jgi:hypothetical protein
MRRPRPLAPVPDDTGRGARAAFPEGHRSLRRAEALATRGTAEAWHARFPTPGQPAGPPWRLARAAPGVAAAVLREVRPRRRAGAAASLRVAPWLAWGRDRRRGKAGGRPRPESTPIVAAVRALTRLAVGGDTLRQALKTLAGGVPERWRAVSPPDGQDRSARRAADDRLPTPPAAGAALALRSGDEGWQRLAAVAHAEAPAWRRAGPAGRRPRGSATRSISRAPGRRTGRA